MRPVVLLSMLFLLASCSSFSKKAQEETPIKNFQYAFQAPTRVLLDSHFSKALNSNNQRNAVNVNLSKHQQSATIKIGRSYFSASGHDCRKYNLQSGQQGAACKISGHWYNASPILLKNASQQH